MCLFNLPHVVSDLAQREQLKIVTCWYLVLCLVCWGSYPAVLIFLRVFTCWAGTGWAAVGPVGLISHMELAGLSGLGRLDLLAGAAVSGCRWLGPVKYLVFIYYYFYFVLLVLVNVQRLV